MASIPAGSAGPVILNVRVQASSGTLQNTASIVSADQADPTAANDSDSLNITISGANSNPAVAARAEVGPAAPAARPVAPVARRRSPDSRPAS